MDVDNSKKYKTDKTISILFYEGFTLVELLVSIVIIGLLAATALPSYLNQASKARGSEAKSSLGAINRAQQAYRWENNTFANNKTLLDVKVDGKFYDYSVTIGDVANAKIITMNRQEGLRLYSAGITQSGDSFVQIICESSNTYAVNTTAIEPTGGFGLPLECPNSYSQVR